MMSQGISQHGISTSRYVELLAALGMTRHLGGWAATDKLFELCKLQPGHRVLDVGCGVGKTACYLGERRRARVVGVDLSDKMVEWARARAARAHLQDKVEFRTADAQSLPFEDNCFDVVFDESVLGFVPDPSKAVREYVRVARPGGFVGLNESSWLKPPPANLEQVLAGAFVGASLTYPDRLRALLEGAGLRDLQVEITSTSARGDVRDRMRWFGVSGLLGNIARIVKLWLSSREDRDLIRQFLNMQAKVPKDLYEYYGYGLYVGQKPL